MEHSKDCTAGLSDIDPTCEACIKQRLDRSRGYPSLYRGTDIHKGIQANLEKQARATPLGQCIAEQEWPDLEDYKRYNRDMAKLKPWNEGIE